MKMLVSHPTGNRNVRAIISSFTKASMLAEFDTTIAVDPNSLLIKLLPQGLQREWLRRSFDVPKRLLWTHPVREICRLLLPKLGFAGIVKHEHGWASVDRVYQNFDTAVANRLAYQRNKNAISAVYAYEDGALVTFARAKDLGLKCVYDLPIAYWQTLRELLSVEAERMPSWKNTLGGGLIDSQEKLDRKTRELELADVVVGPGQFVLDSLPAWANNKKRIMAPFGSPELNSKDDAKSSKQFSSADRPLRILFAGSMGQRKGLGDLFNAMKLVKSRNIELVVMGSLLDSMSFYKSEFPNFTYEVVRPHQDVLSLMCTCDVFCLPSIVEGRALVMQEAMSQGLPIIITTNTGGADLVVEGETGFLIPIRSPEQIAEKIDWFASNRGRIKHMGQAAKAHAALYTWDQYGQNIINKLEVFLK